MYVSKILVTCRGCGDEFWCFENSVAARKKLCGNCETGDTVTPEEIAKQDERLRELSKAKYTVARTDGTPIPEDEPVFVIRASDVMAVAAITTYRDMAEALGQPVAFIAQVTMHLNKVRIWQQEHGRKIPD